MTFLCIKPACGTDCCGCSCAISPEQQLKYAARYAWLRTRPLESIVTGGVFAGLTPDNVVLNGEDLDTVIDQERGATHPQPAQAGEPVIAHVRDFGAVGDGVTDDTAAIQMAADTASQGVPDGIGKGYFENPIVKAWLEADLGWRNLIFKRAEPTPKGEPAGAQAGAKWVEEAMLLAWKAAQYYQEYWNPENARKPEYADCWVKCEPYKALRAHLTTMAAIPEAKEKL